MTHRHAVPAACLAAFAAATLLAPRLAAACDDDRPATRLAVPVSLPPLPPPWVATVLPPPPPGAWGGPSLSVHYRWLDANRAAFLARWGWNPWRVARYDAWYGAYRAGLDARAAPPGRIAWARQGGNGRGHGHGNDRGRGHHDD
jgi:hypothetical protein